MSILGSFFWMDGHLGREAAVRLQVDTLADLLLMALVVLYLKMYLWKSSMNIITEIRNWFWYG